MNALLKSYLVLENSGIILILEFPIWAAMNIKHDMIAAVTVVEQVLFPPTTVASPCLDVKVVHIQQF